MKKPRKVEYYAWKAVRQEEDPCVCAIDTETAGLGGDLLMVQWGLFGEVFTATGPDMIETMFKEVMSYPKPCIWFSHFAQYDWRYFLDYFTESGFEIEIGMRTDTDIYQIIIKNEDGESVILRDSYALWNSPLEKLASTFCPELPKLEIDIENFDPTNPEHITYAKRDVEILLVGLPRLFDLIGEHFNVVAGATTAGTALKAWQKSLGPDEIYDSSDYGPMEEYIRQAYYGGLVFLTDTKVHKDAITYDINSSYPYVMCKYGVPYGRILRTSDYHDDEVGIYRVRVRAPDNLIVAILPARNERGAMRWYSGEFVTCVTSVELKFALKHGYELLEVYEGIVFEKMVYPFDDIIEHCKFLRETFKGKANEMIAKLMQNSLYGKFGTRRERTRIMRECSMNDEDFEGALPYDDDGKWYVKKEYDVDMRCLPQWAVFITAHARIRLLETVYAIGPENVLYGDTDSITVKGGVQYSIDSGNKYGQWKLEKEWAEFRAIAPKVYCGVLGADILNGDGIVKVKKGTWMGAAKGLPRKGITERHWKELLEDGESQATSISLDSFRVAMKNGLKPARQLIRKSSNLENSSNFVALPDGAVRLKSHNEK